MAAFCNSHDFLIGKFLMDTLYAMRFLISFRVMMQMWIRDLK